MSLVADYGTSSSESEDDSDALEEQDTSQDLDKVIDRLPKPDFAGPTASVFSNPFVEAENAESAILEKHVKMVPVKKDTTVINGKKICWNYRKGRCRFGHKCQFAHDSDLQKTTEQLESETQVRDVVICQNTSVGANVINDEDSEDSVHRKKRPGLTQGLIPGKKVMKIYHKHLADKQSWNVNR